MSLFGLIRAYNKVRCIPISHDVGRQNLRKDEKNASATDDVACHYYVLESSRGSRP